MAEISGNTSTGYDGYALSIVSPLAQSVLVSEGDTVDMTLRFVGRQTLTLDTASTRNWVFPWLYPDFSLSPAGQSNFSLAGASLALFDGDGAAIATYEQGPQSNGNAFLGGYFYGTVPPGASLTFSALRTTFVVTSLETGSYYYVGPQLQIGARDGGGVRINRLQDLTLSRSSVAGCKSVTGRVTLSAPAPTSGTVVTITDTLSSAALPAYVKFAAGATTKSFTINTSPVSAPESGNISATLGGTTVSKALTVRPMGLASMTLSPTTVVGSQSVNGTAKLECTAGPGPITVDLSSSSPSVAYPVAASVVIPQGVQSQPFTVATNAVLAKTYAMISGEANGTTKTRKLNVTPAAAVSPTSLKFGNVAVDATSGVLTTTLTNKGAAPFFVDSIGITGSYASWFSQTNNCPSSLAPGAFCTISAKFKPAFASTKSAKLSIVTSATAAPLGVSLSGTGI